MKRPWQAWTAFVVCGAALAAALAWFSVRALALDRSEAEARALAQVEENCRLALWRLDSRMAAILVRESAQPASAYAAFTEIVSTEAVSTEAADDRDASRAGIRGDGRAGRRVRLVPSSLLVDRPPEVRLHVEFDPRGAVRSPQVPAPNRRARAVPRYLSEEQAAECAARLDAARRLAKPAELARRVGALRPSTGVLLAQQMGGDEGAEADDEPSRSAPRTQNMRPFGSNAIAPAEGLSQSARNNIEFAARQQLPLNQQIQFGQNATRPTGTVRLPDAKGPNDARAPVESAASPREDAAPDGTAAPVKGEEAVEPAMGPMAFVWIGEELLLARTAETRRGPIVQVCWLDWPALKRELLDGVVDLLPTADLVAVDMEVSAAVAMEASGDAEPAGQGGASRRLATLPARLQLDHMAIAPASLVQSPIRVALAVLWFSVAAVFVGSALLLRGVLGLSERRAAFVSAVTHELRTPLTTFQLYSEMLAEEMVPDPAARKSYLETLRAEARRLSHLVENVLAYARLERGAGAGRLRDVGLGELLDGLADRLRERTRSAGMSLEVDVGDAGEVVARTDPGAVEQILFNLVDNACKYGASDRGVRIELGESAGRPVVRVRDFGPGVAVDVRRKLFQPFRKSSEAAAESSPGVGLGLSLCRRLARELGGELRWEDGVAPGACFVVELRRGGTGES